MAELKIFRFKHLIHKTYGLEGLEFRSTGPVPILSDNDKIIGFASVVDSERSAIVHCAIDPANPERLDLELDNRDYWLDANLTIRGLASKLQHRFEPAFAVVDSIRLVTFPLDNQDKVSLDPLVVLE
jgi:hypothetical protein